MVIAEAGRAGFSGAIVQPLQRGNIRLAATVMLVRDAPRGLEVFMVKRPGRGDFPDLHVFPGGKVDQADWAPELCTGLSADDADARLGIDAGALRYWVAVARECFEECGVLIVRRGGKVLGAKDPSEFGIDRGELLRDEIGFATLCDRHQLTIDCDSLAYFSHWITPSIVPRRFDTRFFLAAMPHGQTAQADTTETADGEWVRPADALAKRDSGEWLMIDPTIRSLETLSQFGGVAEAIRVVRTGEHLPEWTESLGQEGMQPLRGPARDD